MYVCVCVPSVRVVSVVLIAVAIAEVLKKINISFTTYTHDDVNSRAPIT